MSPEQYPAAARSEGRQEVAVLSPFKLDGHHDRPFFSRMTRRVIDGLRERRGVFLGARYAALNSANAVVQYRRGAVTALVNQHLDARVKEKLRVDLAASQRVPGVRDVLNLSQLAERGNPVHIFDAGGISRDNIYNVFGYRARRLSRQSSITMLHHTVSYRTDVHHTFIPLTIAKARPYDAIVCSSQAARTAIANLLGLASEYLDSTHRYTGRLEVIPYCIDDEVYRPIERAKCRKQLGFSQNKFLFLVFGRVSVADKADLMPAIMAFSILRKSLPPTSREAIQLVIAGNDREGYASILENSIKQLGLQAGVTFLREVSEEQKPLLYNSANVVMSLADNLQECFGLVAAEAMACGIPQIVSDWSGYRDIVINGKTGLTVKTIWSRCDKELTLSGAAHPDLYLHEHLHLAQSVAVDIGKLVESMRCLLENDVLREEMGANSVARARSEYTKSVMSSRLDDLWLESEQIMASDWASEVSVETASPSPRYFDTFSHYASHNFDDKTIIRPSETASLAGLQLPRWPYGKLYGGIDTSAGWSLAEVYTILSSYSNGISIGEAIERLPGLSEDMATRKIMWLVKYGWLKEAP